MTQDHSPPNAQIGVSVREAAAFTSISEKILRDEVSAGNIPARRIGRRIAIDYAGLVAWFNGHEPVVDKTA